MADLLVVFCWDEISRLLAPAKRSNGETGGEQTEKGLLPGRRPFLVASFVN